MDGAMSEAAVRALVEKMFEGRSIVDNVARVEAGNASRKADEARIEAVASSSSVDILEAKVESLEARMEEIDNRIQRMENYAGERM